MLPHANADVVGAGQASLKNWGKPPDTERVRNMKRRCVVDCGWGRLLFGQTFDEPREVADILKQERTGRRDVAFYVREPHVVLACAPQSLFLDPSHTFRLDLAAQRRGPAMSESLSIREARVVDEQDINRLYLSWNMVPLAEGYLDAGRMDSAVSLLVAEEIDHPGEIVGVVMGVDHLAAFDDPDGGSSLWSLAVDPQAHRPGIGQELILALAGRFREAGRAFMDLSVMHDNAEAIALYEKLGFERVPVYCVKKKNSFNEKLFVGPQEEAGLNIYARVIVDEARRRGIQVEVEDTEAGLFRLSHGGRVIACREALSDLTSAVAMSRCDDKTLTLRILQRAGLSVPEQVVVQSKDDLDGFLDRHGRVVVKPARGEQGRGVAVDLRSRDEVEAAVTAAREACDVVVLEQFVAGQDLRIIVIDNEVAAAAVRRPPSILGDGEHSIAKLIEKLSRRRANATDGESIIPMDAETERCVAAAGYAMDDVPSEGESIAVRKTANLHTGGTIHDVTGELHESLAEAAVRAARALEMPVVGFDFMVPTPAGPDYVIIEANERPGLANHEPQPTAERFVDLLFPQTVVDQKRTTETV